VLSIVVLVVGFGLFFEGPSRGEKAVDRLNSSGDGTSRVSGLLSEAVHRRPNNNDDDDDDKEATDVIGPSPKQSCCDCDCDESGMRL
jgi:hypothetical protein